MVDLALTVSHPVPESGALPKRILQGLDDRYSKSETAFPSTEPWAYTDERALSILTFMACPVVCRGVRDPDGEDWHELCESKAKKALAVLRG